MSRVVQENEEISQDLQAQCDATLTEKTNEYEKLEEQFALLKENNTREVCIELLSLCYGKAHNKKTKSTIRNISVFHVKRT